MKALNVTAYGGPEVIELVDTPRPVPTADEVLVRVIAAPVSQADTMMMKGTPRYARVMLGLRRPKAPIPGTGFAGIVEETGANVTAFAPGDAVFGATALGFATLAEFVAVPQDGIIVKKPEHLSFEEVAPLSDGAITSWNFLHRITTIRPGHRVLINGAAGSLGTMAVQYAKAAGAEVTAVCSAKNAGLVADLGADRVIDYQTEDPIKDRARYDLIFDTVGKMRISKARRALRPGGVFLSPVLSIGLLLHMLRAKITGRKRVLFSATGLLKAEAQRPILREIAEQVDAGTLKTVIDSVYGLDHARAAHRQVDTGHKVGNVILQIQPAEAGARAA